MKPLFIFAIVAIFGNVVLGVVNRSKFIAARKEKDEYTRQVIANFEKVDGLNSKTSELIEAYNGEVKNFEADKYAKDTEERTAAQKDSDDKAVIAETDTVQKAMDETNAKIALELKDFGGRPEDLPVQRDALKAEIEGQDNKLAVLDKEIEVTKGVIAENERTIGRMNEGQVQRSRSISLSQREGIITAVNADWGFCILNMGKSDGVSTDSRLLVKRGNQLIGKLKIIQIESGLTVADIDGKSIRAGNRIQPGDQVIFDSAN